MLSIPVLSEPHVDLSVNLDGTDYDLSLRYNQREQRYYLSIYTSEGEEIAKGAPLVCRWPLFRNQTAETRLPPGKLIVLANGADETPPAIGEIGPGKRCELFYLTAAEISEFEAGV